MPKRRFGPFQTWRTFLANHLLDLVSIDFFTVPTARFRVLFVLVVLAHHRRRVGHFNVTEHSTTAWTAQQLGDAFPDDSAPAYLLRDRDRVYGQPFRHRLKGLGIEELLTAPQSPWQNPFVERLIGSIRRECRNHVLVLGPVHSPCAAGCPRQESTTAVSIAGNQSHNRVEKYRSPRSLNSVTKQPWRSRRAICPTPVK